MNIFDQDVDLKRSLESQFFKSKWAALIFYSSYLIPLKFSLSHGAAMNTFYYYSVNHQSGLQKNRGLSA